LGIVVELTVLRLKDAASWAGLVVVSVVALLLGFMPDLVKDQHITQEHAVWLACALTVFSVVCFGVEKLLSSREEAGRATDEAQRKIDEADRKRRDAARDKLLSEMADQLKAIREAQQTATPQQKLAAEQAQTLYSALSIAEREPPAKAAQLLRQGVQMAVNKAPKVEEDQKYFWTDLTAMLKKEFTGSEKDKNEVRSAADSLVRSAFDIPEQKDEK
jgi:hypothetical protein